MKDNSYHNTIFETDEKVIQERETKARKQEEVILRLFQEHPHTSFTPYEVWLRTGQQWPKGSIQRAITNLTQKREKLKITGERRKGEFSVLTNTWQLK